MNLMLTSSRRMGPVVAAYEVEQSRERRLVIAYKQGGTKSFFSALSDLYHSYNFYSTRKYVGKQPISRLRRWLDRFQ